MLSIAIIIVNYNGGSLLARCIQSVLEQTVEPRRIIVVDNNSQDDSIKSISHMIPEDAFILLDENTGFAKANNIAVKAADDCEWIALLNPDAFPEKDWLENFADALQTHPGYDMYASSMVKAADPTIHDSAGDAYYVNGKAWNLKHGQRRNKNDDVFYEVFSPCAGAGFYKRKSFIDAGMFDERYFCYYEDVDLGFRMQLRGYKCLFLFNAVVHHVGSAITGTASDFTTYHAHRNMVWTYFKNMPLPLLIFYFPAFMIVNIGTIAALFKRGKPGVILKSKLHAILGIPAILKTRRKVQKQKRVTSRELLCILSGKSFLKKLLRIHKP